MDPINQCLVSSIRLLRIQCTSPRLWIATIAREFQTSPKSGFRATVNTSSWPALLRLVHASLLDVLAPLRSPVACRLGWLSWTTLDCPEHYSFFLVFAVVVNRHAPVRISAISWRISVVGGGIRCQTKERTSCCFFRPVRVRWRCTRRRPPSWTWRYEEIEVQGPNCERQRHREIVLRNLDGFFK
jgi:hypothetical protein